MSELLPMVHRLDPWFVAKGLHFAVFIVFSTVTLFGCSGNQAVAPVHPAHPSAIDLRTRAQELSARGESHRAEQYFLAALEAGGSPDEIYPELIEACVRGGRFGSALVHIEKRLEHSPGDLRLVRLAISLKEALGHVQAARALANFLTSKQELSGQEELFLGGFFERQQECDRALVHYRAYLATTPPDGRVPWIESAILRVSRLGNEDPIVIDGFKHRKVR